MKFDVAAALAVVNALLASAGFWGWLTERDKRKTQKQATIDDAQATIADSQASFVSALNKQSEDFIKALQVDRRLLNREVAGLKKRVAELQAAHDQCQGDYAQAVARMDGLERVLAEHGVPIPGRPPPGSFVVLEGPSATMFTPDNEQPAQAPRPRRRRNKGSSNG